MAEIERDEGVTQAYRALGGEGPPPALDAAILAAARRRGGRWHAPVAAAAVLTLAVGVAVVVQREAPEQKKAEVALAPQAIRSPAPEAAAGSAAGAPQLAAPKANADDRAAAGEARRDAPAKREALASAKTESQRASREALPEDRRQSVAKARGPAPAAQAPAQAASAPSVAGNLRESGAPMTDEAAAEKPGPWLERIAKLREAGRDREADDSLAEFRRRYPAYEIPKELRARVLGR